MSPVFCAQFCAAQIEANPVNGGCLLEKTGISSVVFIFRPFSSPSPSLLSFIASLKKRTITMAEKKLEASHAEEQASLAAQKLGEEEEEEDTTTCPLFMDGLPSNFAENKSLAAIASLLNEEDDEDDAKQKNADKEDGLMSKVELKSGGGKVQRKIRRKGSSPYNKDKKKGQNGKKAASVGEAQLFLNMWKI